jgi:hypothetical protein
MRFSRTVVSLVALAALSFAATAEAQTRAHRLPIRPEYARVLGSGRGQTSRR